MAKHHAAKHFCTKPKCMRASLVAVLVLLGGQVFSQANNNRNVFKLQIYPVTSDVQVDGVLDEADWRRHDAADSFWVNSPVDDRRAAASTRVYILSGPHAIYIGAEIKNRGAAIVQTLKRDAPFEESDAFGVVIDPEAQKTLGYMFGVNAAGAQSEAIVSAAQGVFADPVDYSWDAKWLSAIQKTADGWTVEMAIPYKAIRFDKAAKEWAINFFRVDRFDNEVQVWARVPVQFRPSDLGFTGSLSWYSQPVAVKRNVSITPYTLAARTKDNDGSQAGKLNADVGGDAKIALTPTLNLDLTLNPDFSQVDVDQQVTNLTRFSVFFPEKRQFFLENADIFTNFNSYPDAPFFSRRIGLDEHGKRIPVLYGARLSGSLNAQTRIGVLNMHTKTDTAGLSQNYTAAAFHRRILKRSTLRGMFLNRSAFQDWKMKPSDYSRNASLEFEYLSDNGKWGAKISENLGFKPGVTDRNSYSILGLGHYGRKFQTYAELQRMGTRYSADMGFISRLYQYDPETGLVHAEGYTALSNVTDYNIYPKSGRIVRHWMGAENYVWWVRSGLLNEWYTRLRYFFFFRNTSIFRVRINNDYVNLLYPFQITSGKPLPAKRYNFTELNLQYNTDIRRRLSAEVNNVYGSFYNGRKLTMSTTLSYRMQPWGTFIMGFQVDDIRLPDPYGNAVYLLINPKVEVDFSRELFWTTFVQYSSQERNFSVNSRLQWRYRPMSDLFLVLTNNYRTENRFGPKNSSVVLKWNYYFQL